MITENETLRAALRLVRRGEIDAANALLAACGVEYLSTPTGAYAYLNTGDTYSQTIIWPEEHPRKAYIGAWGDTFEADEDEYCREEGVIRCGYCGEYTPMDREDWRDVVCEYCKHSMA